MNYSNRRRRYRKYIGMRGGYKMPLIKNTAKQVLYEKAIPAVVTYAGVETRKRFPRATQFADKMFGNPFEQVLLQYLADNRSKTGSTIPGVGVITTPFSKSFYAKATNKGTGITRSTYTVGKSRGIPRNVANLGYKCNRVVSDTGSNFSLSNPDGNTRGITEFVSLTAGVMAIYQIQFPSSLHVLTPLAKLYMANMKSVITVTSATNINVSLRVYEMVSKIDTNDANYRTPVSAWSTGLDEKVGLSVPSTYSLIGIYPSMSDYLREYWHIDAYYDIELPAGQSHIHTSTYNINKVFPACRWANRASTSTIAGLTRSYLFVLSTTPVHDSVVETNVSLGVGKVDINITQNSEFWAVPASDSQLSWTVTGDAVTTAEVVSDADLSETGLVN